MRRAPLAVLMLLVSACGGEKQTADRWGRTPDLALKPVADRNAPTVKELQAAGFLIADHREAACASSTPGSVCEGFDALYLAKGGSLDERRPSEFACPGTKAPVDDWKCRKLDPPYVSNGGFAPLVADGG